MTEKRFLLKAETLAELLSVSKRTVWRWKSAGKLPKPVTIGASVRWRQEDINQWIALDCPNLRTFEAREEGAR